MRITRRFSVLLRDGWALIIPNLIINFMWQVAKLDVHQLFSDSFVKSFIREIFR